MTPTNLPPHGAHIVFDRPPRGSWARAGEAYLVSRDRRGGDVRVTLADRPGVGTYDRPWTYAGAIWRMAAANGSK